MGYSRYATCMANHYSAATDRCIGMRIDTCRDMCTDMREDMCRDEREDTCGAMCSDLRIRFDAEATKRTPPRATTESGEDALHAL